MKGQLAWVLHLQNGDLLVLCISSGWPGPLPSFLLTNGGVVSTSLPDLGWFSGWCLSGAKRKNGLWCPCLLKGPEEGWFLGGPASSLLPLLHQPLHTLKREREGQRESRTTFPCTETFWGKTRGVSSLIQTPTAGVGVPTWFVVRALGSCPI